MTFKRPRKKRWCSDRDMHQGAHDWKRYYDGTGRELYEVLPTPHLVPGKGGEFNITQYKD